LGKNCRSFCHLPVCASARRAGTGAGGAAMDVPTLRIAMFVEHDREGVGLAPFLLVVVRVLAFLRTSAR
jgi:hypothetical protein